MITLQNKKNVIEIDEINGLILSFSNTKVNFLSKNGSPIFDVGLRNKETVTEISAPNCTFINATINTNKVVLEYESKDKLIAIKSIISKDCEQGFEFFIDVENRSELLIDYIDYPAITVDAKLIKEGGRGRIVWPYNEGHVIENMDKRMHSEMDFIVPQCPTRMAAGVYPNMVESQFIAYLLDDCGLYMGMHDKEFGVKGLDSYPTERGIKFMLRIFTGLNYGQSFKATYPVVVRSFLGDWMDCADIYKSWYEKNKPSKIKKITERDDLPEWYYDSPTIVIYPVRGKKDSGDMTPNKLFPYINAIKHIEKIAEETGSRVMALLMHWEGTAPWSAPIVWPPYGGIEELAKFEKALHSKGNLLGVYCSGMGFTEVSNTDPTYNQKELLKDEEILNSLCVAPDGNLAKSKLVLSQRFGYDMCPKSEKTKEIMVGEVKSMVEANIDYIQIFDQDHGGNSCFCYADNHGHSVSPGVWQTQEMMKMMERFVSVGNKTTYGCESAAADCFLNYLSFSDNRYHINYHSGGYSIPLYGYLYHEYLNNFSGNGSWLGFVPSKDNLFFRLAYSFVAGDMISLIMNEDGDIMQYWTMPDGCDLPDRKAVMKLVKQMNRWRREEKKYLLCGKMVRPYDLIYDERLNRYAVRHDINVHTARKLMMSRFMAEDGSTAQFVVNYNEHEVTIKLNDGGPFKIMEEPHGKEKIINSYTIPPYTVVMLKL